MAAGGHFEKNKACVSRNCNTNARIKFIIDTAIDDLEWKNSSILEQIGIHNGGFPPLFANFPHLFQLFPTFPHFSPLFPIFSHFSLLFPTFGHFPHC